MSIHNNFIQSHGFNYHHILQVPNSDSYVVSTCTSLTCAADDTSISTFRRQHKTLPLSPQSSLRKQQHHQPEEQTLTPSHLCLLDLSSRFCRLHFQTICRCSPFSPVPLESTLPLPSHQEFYQQTGIHVLSPFFPAPHTVTTVRRKTDQVSVSAPILMTYCSRCSRSHRFQLWQSLTLADSLCTPAL